LISKRANTARAAVWTIRGSVVASGSVLVLTELSLEYRLLRFVS
jgi:hypothetical protein